MVKLEASSSAARAGHPEGPEVESRLQPVVAALERVSRSTEEVYQRIGDAFPSLVRELASNFGGGDHDDSLAETVGQALGNIAAHEVHFRDSHDATAQMLAELAAQLGSLGKLDDRVKAIREDSELMELISLNALVIAVRAGESGRAFSCITSELKELTGKTIGLTQQIAGTAAALDSVFGEFREGLARMTAQEQADFADFLSNVRQVFEGLETSSSQLWGGLAGIRQRSDEVRVPLVRIVVDIQNQDRVRQGIDHVLLALGEFQGVGESEEIEDQLNEISFMEILTELASQVLAEVSDQIAANRGAFAQALSEARRTMAALESDRRTLLTEHLESRRQGSLERWFEDGQAVFQAFVKTAEGSSRSRENAFKRSAVLHRHVSDLVAAFGSFDFVLSKFRTIDLASRIQVARHAALASMKDNAFEMSRLTGAIGTDVGEATEITNGFFVSVDRVIQLYREQVAARFRQDETFHRRLQESLLEIQRSKDDLRSRVLGTQVFTRTFTDQFERTEADLVTLDGLLVEIREQQRTLQTVHGDVALRKRGALAKAGLTKWTISSEKLKTMIDRFTIFTHKKIAAGLGGYEVEEAVDAGEVTLF